jgi:hypothetical protein
VEIPTDFKIKNVVLQGDGAGRGSFCPCRGRGQGILTPVQAHEAFQEISLFILPHLVLKGHKHCWGSASGSGMYLALPVPFVTSTDPDPDPSIIKQN